MNISDIADLQTESRASNNRKIKDIPARVNEV